jgi:predicted RNA-binding protein with PUA-like domain
VWDGVNSTVGQSYMKQIAQGDRIIGYHTAPEKCVYGILEAASRPYQNPRTKEKNLVVKVCVIRKFRRPVPLAELKANPKLKNMKVFKLFRPVAVTPLTPDEYAAICTSGDASS